MSLGCNLSILRTTKRNGAAVDSGRQILRYSIPGSVLVLAAAGGFVGFRISAGKPISSLASNGPTTATVVALAGLSIPLGFLLYQVYYFAYSPFTFRRYPTTDRGAEVLKHLSCDQRVELFKKYGIASDTRTPYVRNRLTLALVDWKNGDCSGQRTDCPCVSLEYSKSGTLRGDYVHRWENNWNAALATLALPEQSEYSKHLKAEYVSLSDIYHSLGAARLAIALSGWLSAAFFLFGFRSFRGLLWFFAYEAALVFLYVALHRSRAKTNAALLTRIGQGLRVGLSSPVIPKT